MLMVLMIDAQHTGVTSLLHRTLKVATLGLLVNLAHS
jgi:hypothetical protein